MATCPECVALAAVPLWCARGHQYNGTIEKDKCPQCGLHGHTNKADANAEAFDLFHMRTPHVIHWRSIRLFNNAGMDFPACYASTKLLDLDKSRLRTNPERHAVTCKRCLRLMEKR